MAAAANQVRAAHHNLDAVGVAGLGGLCRRGEFGEVDPVGGAGRDLVGGRVVMAGQDRPVPPRLGHHGRLMQRAETVAQRKLRGDMGGPFILGHPVLAGVVVL